MPSDPNVNIRELIARIDERTITLLKSHQDLKTTVESSVEHIEKNYTKKSEFEPVKKLVFGFVGFLLLSIGGMFVGLLVRTNSSALQDIPAGIIKNIAPAVMNAIPPPSPGR